MANTQPRLAVHVSGHDGAVSGALRELPSVLGSLPVRLWYSHQARRNFKRSARGAKRWICIGGAALERNRHLLPFLMASAPRWNVHALIIAGPPLLVGHRLRVELESLSRAAGYWSLAVVSSRSNKVVGRCSAAEASCTSASFTLRRGTYRLVVRLYEWQSEVRSPALEIDGAARLPSQLVEHDNNEFYRRILAADCDLLKAVNRYPMWLLKHRALFAERYVKRVFLPAADHGVEMRFGYLRRGDSLRVEAHGDYLRQHAVYFCCYSESSLPLYWCKVRDTPFTYVSAERAGCYLIRILPLGASAERSAQS